MGDIPKGSMLDVLIKLTGIGIKDEKIYAESVKEIVENLAAEIEQRGKAGGVTSDELAEIVGELARSRFGQINCYLGIKAQCYPLAVFISLTSPMSAKGSCHLSFRQAMESIIQHMLGRCQEITDAAAFITDSWDVGAFDEWRPILLNIKNKARLTIYVLKGGKASLIDF